MRAALLILALLASPIVLAEPIAPKTENGDGGSVIQGISEWANNQGKPAPSEEGFTLPSVASLGNWAPFTFPQMHAKTSFKVSLDSLSVGKDKIVRYAVAIKPANGNVTTLVFEGLDCETNQYRHYASASADTEWRMALNKGWKPNQQKAYNAWQGHLADEFCFMSSPYSVETIKKSFGASLKNGYCRTCVSDNKN